MHLRRAFGRLNPAQAAFLLYGLQTFSRLDLEDFDIIHASNYPASNAAALIRKRDSAAAIWGCNEPYRDLWLPANGSESYISRAVNRTVGGAMRRLDVRLVSRLDAVYVNSRYTRALVKRIYGRTATIIYPGVDPGLYGPSLDGSDLKEHCCPRGENLILTVSRLYPAKKIDILIKALRRLRDRGERVRLLIIGEGPERDRLQRLAHGLGLAGEVLFEGAVPEEEMRRFYAAADVFAFAAPDEPWGLAVLEAMASGLPVVVPGTAGPAESVEDGVTGLHVAGEDLDEYAEKLGMIIADRELAERIGRSARSKVQKSFTVERMVDSLEAFYVRVLEGCHQDQIEA